MSSVFFCSVCVCVCGRYKKVMALKWGSINFSGLYFQIVKCSRFLVYQGTRLNRHCLFRRFSFNNSLMLVSSLTLWNITVKYMINQFNYTPLNQPMMAQNFISPLFQGWHCRSCSQIKTNWKLYWLPV